MSIQLPSIVAAYFDAENAHDPDAVAACFGSDAVVRDDGKIIAGSAAIRAWKQAGSAQYGATVAPTAVAATPRGHRVTTTVSGNFPGSPLVIYFDIAHDERRISAMEIGV